MSKLLRLLAVSCIIFLSLSPASVCAAFDEADYQKFVNSEMKTWNVPGAAILIIQDGKVVFAEGFGYRDIKNKLPVTSRTLFGIGSCSKAFTSLSIGLLVDEKKVDLDKPVREYYPALKLYDAYATEYVTVRDILSHRTGIPRYDIAIDPRDATRDIAVARLKYLKPSKGIREQFQYNNFHYVLAGAIVDKTTGTAWEEFVSKRIFKPLGMDGSNFSTDDSKKSNDFALPHKMDTDELKKFPESKAEMYGVPLKELPFENIGVYGPAGSINSNLMDMAKWILLHLNNGKAGDKQIISKDVLFQLFLPQMLTGSPLKYDEILPGSYGMGWMITPYRGHYLVSHDGMIEGFTAHVGFLPAKKAGLVILTNKSSNYEFIASTAFSTYDRILGLTEIAWSKRFLDDFPSVLAALKEKKDKEEKSRIKDTTPSHALTGYTGKYEHPAFGVVKIELKDNSLKLSLRGMDEATSQLRHYQYDTFRMLNKSPIDSLDFKITFLTGKDGEIESLTIPLEVAADEVVFRKVTK